VSLQDKNNCGKCRFRLLPLERCGAEHSEHYGRPILDIKRDTEGAGCDSFFSENDIENMSAASKDPYTEDL